MRRSRSAAPRREQGQALVIMVGALAALLAVTALVIDGGNAYTQQRITQNATDAAAEAGAVVLAQNIGRSPAPFTDTDVSKAVTGAITAPNEGLSAPVAYYTDIAANLLTPGGSTTMSLAAAAKVGAGVIPPNAAGVEVFDSKTFNTLVAGAIGFNTLSASTKATAVAGYVQQPCDSSQGCALLPVTFPVSITTCTGNGDPSPPGSKWPVVNPPYNASNEAIVALCMNGPGSVGWLDICPSTHAPNCTNGDNDIKADIQNPDNGNVPIPVWLQTQTGANNNLDSYVNAYDGQVVLLPMFDCTAKSNLGVGTPCPSPPAPGNGNNTWYHIPYFVGFLLDQAYIQGNNKPECNSLPGSPFAGGNGSTSCLKGWFVRTVTQGPVSGGPGAGGSLTPVGVQLIR